MSSTPSRGRAGPSTDSEVKHLTAIRTDDRSLLSLSLRWRRRSRASSSHRAAILPRAHGDLGSTQTNNQKWCSYQHHQPQRKRITTFHHRNARRASGNGDPERANPPAPPSWRAGEPSLSFAQALPAFGTRARRSQAPPPTFLPSGSFVRAPRDRDHRSARGAFEIGWCVSHFCNAIDLTRSKQRAPYHHHHASESESDLESEANARTGRSDMLLPLIGTKPRPHLPFAREHLPPQTNDAEPAARCVACACPRGEREGRSEPITSSFS